MLRVHGAEARALRPAVEHEIDAIDAAASRFRPDSELSRVNRARGAWVTVSPLFAEAVALACRAAVVSAGAVDPTLGRSLIVAGYDRDWDELMPVPAGHHAQAAPRPRVTIRRRAAWHGIELSEDPLRVRVPMGVALDLGATAKALAADRAARAAHRAAHAAHRAGGAGVLVSLGGDVATAGPAPAEGWMVHVTDDHRFGAEAPGQTVSISSGGLATSSVITRRWLHRGEAMHHIIDPRTGGPVPALWRTVSVAAASCADANIGSTASIVLGDEAAEWLRTQSIPARLVAVDGTVLTVGGWPS